MTAQSSPTDNVPLPLWSPSFSKAFQQWEEENAKYGADYENLKAMIAKMLAEIKSGHVQQAFQTAQMDVMPGAMQVQGDSMGQLAASMNIASALQESMTNAENSANNGGKITKAEVAQFIKSLQELYAEVSSASGQKWMGASTAKNILDAIKQICGTFYDANNKSVDNPYELNPKLVQEELQGWSKNPTHVMFNGKTGQQNIQDLQAAMTQSTNGISSQSQGLQAEEQFAANTFTQYMNVCKGIFQATQRQDQSFVQNQKG